jgi:hypothetical protein
MSHFAFTVLCVLVGLCYYAVLIISAKAVGEETSALLMPLAIIPKLWRSFVGCAADAVTRRRGRQYQALEFEDEDANAPAEGAVN